MIALYAFELTFGITVANLEIFRAGGLPGLFMFPALASIAMYLRIGMLLNKYLVWSIMVPVAYVSRLTTMVNGPINDMSPIWMWPAIFGLAGAAVLRLGQQKVKDARARSKLQ